MKKKFSLLLVAVLMFSLVLTACGGNGSNVDNGKDDENTSTLQKIQDSGKIILGTSADYPPFEFHTMIDGKDEIVGFDIEIAKYIADELGVELVIQDMDFDKLLGGLSTGMLDMVIAGMNPDPGREANFTDIYYEANISVLAHKDNASQFTKVEDLYGKSVGAQIGTVQEDIARESIKDADVKALTTNSDIVMNLKTKKLQAGLLETPVAESYAAVNDDLLVIEDFVIDSGTGGVAVAVQKGDDELTQKLNEILEDIKSQGLIEKWFIEANKLVSDSI